MHFGENQLSRSLIGLSPLPTAHPPGFQPRRVRPSTRSYTCLSLAMGRSPRFGSRTRHCTPSFGLALATATPHGLTSRHATDSQAHSSIGTPPPPTPHEKRGGGRALTARRRPVSGTLSLPSRGTFHRSLTVLLRYRSPGGIQAAGWSQQIHTGFHVPRATRAPCQRGRGSSAYGALTLHGPPSQGVRLPPRFLTTPPPRQEQDGTTPQPRRGRPCRVTSTTTVSAIIRFRSPLLTEYPLLRVLRCFTSPRNPHTPYTFRRG